MKTHIPVSTAVCARKSVTMVVFRLSFLLLSASISANGFVVPKTSLFTASPHFSLPLKAMPTLPDASIVLLADVPSDPRFLAGQVVGDGVRSIVLGIVSVLIIISLISVIVTTFVLPGQLEDLEVMMKEKDPDAYNELQSQLKDGETIMERPDLMMELGNLGMEVAKKEDEIEMQKLIVMVKAKQETGEAEELRSQLEEALGLTIEQYIQLVEKTDAAWTDTDRELADVLKSSF